MQTVVSYFKQHRRYILSLIAFPSENAHVLTGASVDYDHYSISSAMLDFYSWARLRTAIRSTREAPCLSPAAT